MELQRVVRPSVTLLSGQEGLTLPEKTHLRVQVKEQGAEWIDLLDAQVPNNKAWQTRIGVSINEVDA